MRIDLWKMLDSFWRNMYRVWWILLFFLCVMILSALWYSLALLVIFYLLAKICDEYFIKSLEIIVKKLRLSEDVAGATFMAIGTSAPEFFTAVIALIQTGKEWVWAGTIIGSALFNILIIVWATALVKRAVLNPQPVMRDMGFYVLSIVILLFTFYDGVIHRREAALYLLAYALYIVVLSYRPSFVRSPKPTQIVDIPEEVEKIEQEAERRIPIIWPILKALEDIIAYTFPNIDKKPSTYGVVFTISIVYIIALSYLLVESWVWLAHTLWIPEVIIALTILAWGTSVPDMLSSIIVARKGKADMAVSNAVGSNTFDILVCLGLPWFLFSLYTGRSVVVSTDNLMISIGLLFGVVVLMLLIFGITRFTIWKKIWYILISVYVLYLLYAVAHSYQWIAF